MTKTGTNWANVVVLYVIYVEKGLKLGDIMSKEMSSQLDATASDD